MVEFDFNSCRMEFVRYMERMEFSEETIKGYQKDLEFFERFMREWGKLENFSIEKIEKSDLVAFMDYGKKLGHKTNTIARRLATIKSFYKFLVMEMDYPIDVAARIQLPKTYVPLRGILTEKEVQRLLNSAKELGFFYYLLFSTIYYTGSRLTPVRTLRWENVHLEERIFYFPRVKGGKDLYIPMHDKLVLLYEQYMEQCASNIFVFPSPKFYFQPISASDVRSKLQKATINVNIQKKVTPHTLRHTTATHLTLKKIDQRSIAAILGHTDLRSTMRYQHISVEHLREPLGCL